VPARLSGYFVHAGKIPNLSTLFPYTERGGRLEAQTMTGLLIRRVSESRVGAEGQDDYDVIGANGLIIGRIFRAVISPPETPWMWTLAYGQHEDRTMHGYEPTREAAMATFAKSWRRE
jgi:hypothetical protein